MPTTRRRRLQAIRRPLDAVAEHFLVTGCYLGKPISFDIFNAGGDVIRGNLATLRELWTEHGDEIKRRHRGETFAECVLAGGDWRDRYGRLHCQEHPV